MNIALRHVALATAALVALSGELWGQNKNTNRTPADAWFADSPTDKIKSDDSGSYFNGPSCVTTWVDSGGFFFLRTVTPNCTPYTRKIVLDFSDPVSPPASCVEYQFGIPLHTCGSNTVPDVRIIAQSLFKNTALANGTTVTLPFNLQPSFSGSGGSFELDFELPVPVSGDSTFRVLQAGGNAVAELYQYVNAKKTSVGRYRMPFQLSVTKH